LLYKLTIRVIARGGSGLPEDDITRLLKDWSGGDGGALDELTPLVYDRLKRLAASAFSGESAGHTLQPTALVSELFEKLIGSDIDWQDRQHFYALSARLMRRILVNHAQSRNARKRGGDLLQVTLQDSATDGSQHDPVEILALDSALAELQAFDERKAAMLELHYFGGLTYSELSATLEVAESTVHQDLRTAKAWLNSRLGAA
jgi:RNA polymerase sigma factor (TIGR02999 family)